MCNAKRSSIMEGEASSNDIAQLKEVLTMLREKKQSLLAKRESLQARISEISEDIKVEKQKSEEINTSIQIMKQKIEAFPPAESRTQADELMETIAVLRHRLEELTNDIESQKDEKQKLLDLIYTPITEKTRRNALKFIRQSLQTELASLVAHGASAEELQKKERQLRICDSLQNM